MPARLEFVDIAGLVARRVEGRRARQPVPRHTSARSTRSRMSCAASRTTTSCTWRASIDPDRRHRDDRDRADAGRPRSRREATPSRCRSTRKSGDKEAKAHRRAARARSAGARAEGKPGAARADSTPRRSAALQAVLQLLTAKPALYVGNVDEAAASTATPLLATGARRTPRREGAPVVAVCAAIEAEIADLDGRRPARVSRRPRAWPSPASTASSARATSCSASDLLHRRPEGSARLDGRTAAPGAAGRGRHPHRFREGLHPRRDDRLRRLIAARASRARRTRARCGSKARSTSSRTAT